MNDLGTVPATAIWKDTEMLECVWVIPKMANTATFTFQAASGALFDFLSGQCLTLELPVAGGVIHRTVTGRGPDIRGVLTSDVRADGA